MAGPTKIWTPFTAPFAGWDCDRVSISKANGFVVVTVAGKYQEAAGSYRLIFGQGRLQIAYDFTVTKGINPRQIGLVFSLPREYEAFSWERGGS